MPRQANRIERPRRRRRRQGKVPALEQDGTIRPHTLLISGSSQMETFDLDRPEGTEGESERFPMPELPPVGGRAVPIAQAQANDIRPAVGED
jgi:hypothetical protein